MAYTREGIPSFDPTTNRVNKNSSPMDKAYDDLVAAINESNIRNSRPRSKASDTSRMNKVYKPKASPGPATNTLNLYGAAKSRTGGNSNAREDRKPKPAKTTPNANAREDRKPKPKVPASAKTLNKYGAAKPRLGGNANARENRKPQGRNTGRGD